MLGLKHCSCPVDSKFKIFFFPPVKGGPKSEWGGQMSLGQKPIYTIYIVFCFFEVSPKVKLGSEMS